MMGYMRHHSIIVTSRDADSAASAHAEACRTFAVVSPLLLSEVNGYHSFFVPPDGSKEGWPDSDAGDARRSRFIAWLAASVGYLDWAEVQYGDEEGQTRIVADSDESRRAVGEP